MSSFFTIPASQRKRKRQEGPRPSSGHKKDGKKAEAVTPAAKRPRKEIDDESISGSDSDEDRPHRRAPSIESDNSDSAANETAAERRLKLAERYLESIRAEVGQEQEVGFDAEEIDRELIAARLKEDVAEEKGRIYRSIGPTLNIQGAEQCVFRADTLATTGVACSPPYIYTVSKDMTFIKWEMPMAKRLLQTNSTNPTNAAPRRRKPKQLIYTRGDKRRANDHSYQHHTSAILCVAASVSGEFVVTGGADRRVIVWNASTLKPLKVFSQHRDAVTALAFRGKTNQLFSASKDRTIKIWSLDELAYVETLFGHQDEVLDVAAVGGKEERCVTVGARDRSARLWKVVEESQLVFRGGGEGAAKRDKNRNGTSTEAGHVDDASFCSFMEGSLDRVIQIDTHLFVTGSDSGAISLYGLHKKKPLHVISVAHGVDPAIQPQESSAEVDVSNMVCAGRPTPRWITALASVPFTDLFVSGSWDGSVRLWRVSSDQKRIESLGAVGKSETLTSKPAIHPETNGYHHRNTSGNGDQTAEDGSKSGQLSAIKGIVNDLAVFELEPGVGQRRGKVGVCIIAGTGQESRLGRWVKVKGAINGACMFTIPAL